MATITLPLGIPLPLPGPHNVCLPAHFVPDYLGARNGLRPVNALSHDHSTVVTQLMG